SVQRHFGAPSPRDASSAQNLAAGHVSHGHFHSWHQRPKAVSVARDRLPKCLASDASDPSSHGCGSAPGATTHNDSPGSLKRTRPISATSRARGTVVHGRDGDGSRAVATGSPACWWLRNEVVEYGWKWFPLTVRRSSGGDCSGG